MPSKYFMITVFTAAAFALVVGAIAANQSVTAGAALPPVWQGLDLDGDHRITREEMRISAQERFRNADMNGDGKITREEWTESASLKSRPESLARSFEMMDSDRNGVIERHEIRQPPQNAGIFDRMDRDQNGALTRDELTNFKGDEVANRPVSY